ALARRGTLDLRDQPQPCARRCRRGALAQPRGEADHRRGGRDAVAERSLVARAAVLVEPKPPVRDDAVEDGAGGARAHRRYRPAARRVASTKAATFAAASPSSIASSAIFTPSFSEDASPVT